MHVEKGRTTTRRTTKQEGTHHTTDSPSPCEMNWSACRKLLECIIHQVHDQSRGRSKNVHVHLTHTLIQVLDSVLPFNTWKPSVVLKRFTRVREEGLGTKTMAAANALLCNVAFENSLYAGIPHFVGLLNGSLHGWELHDLRHKIKIT